MMKIKSLIKQYGFFYLLGCCVILLIKHRCRNAGSDELKWILAPTAWWVQTISGTVFEYQPPVGYVSHGLRFIIAPSCSGVQFMLISIAVFLFSFIHRMQTRRDKFFWLLICIAGSYAFTITVNSLRIILAIYLPPCLPFPAGMITPAGLHSLIGIVVYFSALLAGYQGAVHVSQNMAGRGLKEPAARQNIAWRSGAGHFKLPPGSFAARCLPPVFWYLFMVLAIPFFNRIYRRDFNGFSKYALLIVMGCMAVLALYYLGCCLINKKKSF